MLKNQTTREKRRQLQSLIAQIPTANPFGSVTISRQIKDLSAEITDEDDADDTRADDRSAVTAG